ncbi:MAG: hypothetical protein EPN38_12440 [Rhodanobacteraceae bacterium]|nr:MAG: hypothetical protein EPN38_12440 [Rhodanobacteraceae bacterium]
MKRLSPWLAVLILCSVPLTAAAFDYGPDQTLLAGSADAPQLPGAAVREAARGELPRPDVMPDDAATDSDPPAPAPHATQPAAAPARPGPAIGKLGPSASNKPRIQAAHPTPAPAASWQSLLPGSIQ